MQACELISIIESYFVGLHLAGGSFQTKCDFGKVSPSFVMPLDVVTFLKCHFNPTDSKIEVVADFKLRNLYIIVVVLCT